MKRLRHLPPSPLREQYLRGLRKRKAKKTHGRGRPNPRKRKFDFPITYVTNTHTVIPRPAASTLLDVVGRKMNPQ